MHSKFVKHTNLFVDVHNVFFYTDIFLIHELYSRFETHQIIRYLFSSNDIFKVCAHYEPQDMDIVMKLETAKKEHKNYLLDLIDKDRFQKVCTNKQHLDQSLVIKKYVDNLRDNLLKFATCGQYLQLTEYGAALLLLAKDQNFQTCYLYTEHKNEFVQRQINTILHGDGAGKFMLVSGPKEKAIQQCQPIDSYTIEDCNDLSIIAKTSNHPAEVIIPYYQFNAAKDRSEEEIVVEQILGPRLDFNRWNHTDSKSDMEFFKKYNLSVNTIMPPI